MSKKELAHLYFPLAETDSAARHALLYLTQHARQDPGELTADDSLLWREDRKVYLMDVLHDLGYSECALKLSADQVAAILHFLGPVPDEEDAGAAGVIE